MNWYAPLESAKTFAGVTGSGSDALFGEAIEAASREVDLFCRRHFYVTRATKYFNAMGGDELVLGDVLTSQTFGVDSEGDQTFDGEVWVEGTDYQLLSWNAWPKWAAKSLPTGRYLFGEGARRARVTGTWGYGDGERSHPVDALGVTATVADATSTTIELSAVGTIAVGQTLYLPSTVENTYGEQVFVLGVTDGSEPTMLVTRGVNGTTAIAHAAIAVSVFVYPPTVVRSVMNLAARSWHLRGKDGIEYQRIGNYTVRFRSPELYRRDMDRMLSSLKVRRV